MRHLWIAVTAAAILGVTGPLSAQVPPAGTPQSLPPATYNAPVPGQLSAQVPPAGAPQSLPPATYTAPVQRYPFPGTTPEDAYRAGLINRLELERFGGPIPPALQGPSANGDRMFQ